MISLKTPYIPIDFIKVELRGINRKELESNTNLDFKSIINRATGEISEFKTAYYKNLKIIIFKSGRIWLSGSLHVCFNEGKHNYNNYGLNEFKTVLNELENALNLKPYNMFILNLEWGFNIELKTNISFILDRLLQHKSINKTVGLDCKIEGKYIQFKHSNYILKIYDKGTQFKLNKNLVRIEIKQMNWSCYRKKGIVTLRDFIEADKSLFLNEPVNQWQSVILYDINHNITKDFIEYSTLIYWNDLRNKGSRRKFKYHFDKLKELNNSKGYGNQDLIADLIKSKCNELQL